MRLQKRLGRKYKDKEYHKWIVVLPEEEIKNAGFKEGDKLQVISEKDKITIKRW